MEKAELKATEAVSNFIANTTYEKIPAHALELAKIAVTDLIGVALAGTGEDLAGYLQKYIEGTGGAPQATLWGSGYRTSVENASLYNGAVAHALDFDDWALTVHGHPSVYLVPNLLALAEQHGYSGRDILAAYVVGFETVAMLPYFVTQAFFDQGWHPTGVTGTLGSCAAVCNLLKIPADKIKYAIGMACAMAAGIRANNGTMCKPLHAGNAAMNGVKAAKLAALGFDSVPDMLEVKRGFIKSFGYNEPLDWEPILNKLGKEYQICGEQGLNIKPYPCAGGANFAIDAVMQLRNDYTFELDEIADIDLLVNTVAGLALIHHNPTTGLQGKFSMEYVVARSLLTGPVRLEHFTDEAVNDPAVKALINKMHWTEVYPTPSKEGNAKEFDPKGVRLHLKDGRILTRECFAHLGMPSRPMPHEMIEAKYRNCAGMALPSEKVEKSLKLLNGFEKLEDVSALIENLH